METNKNLPLPETCKELGEAFPEWETHNATIYNNGVFDYVGVFFELKEDTDIYPAPSFQELWEKLPKHFKEDPNSNTLHLRIESNSIKYAYKNGAYPFVVKIQDDHITEAMAQMILILKKQGKLDGK